MKAEIDSSPKKAVQKKKQAENAFSSLHQNAYAMRQDQTVQKKESFGESGTALSGAVIPAVHGSSPAYSAGSEKMHEQLKSSLDETGNLSHPETQQKEKDYKSTLSIPELREYNDAKLADSAAKDTAENTAVVIATANSSDGAAAIPKRENILETTEKPEIANAAQQNVAGDTNEIDVTVSAENDIAAVGGPQEGKIDAPISYLDMTASEEVLAISISAINVMASNTATTKPASVKIKESQLAQVTPQSENQGVSNTSQVESLAQKNVPQKTGDASKRSLAESVDKAIPRTKKDIQDFKENNKGAQISKALVKQVNSNVNSVRQDFGGIEQKATAVPGKAGTPLPAPEQAKNTPANFKGELVPTLKKEAFETKQYIDEASSELTKEGITQQQLDMVDKGDLAEARKAKKEIEDNATKLPSEAEKSHAKEKKAVNTQLKEAETTSRASMHNDRNQLLKQTGTQQTKAKTDLEKKRDEVYKNINSRYDNCKARVIKKLNDLEKNSLSTFDSLQRLATNLFEITVNKRVDAFFDKRYSGWRGVGNWFSDIGVNDDDFAQVKKIFKEERNAYVTKIDGYIDLITHHSNTVIKECKDELNTTKKAIAAYVKTLATSLQDIGKKAQGEVNQKLQQLDREIEQRRKKLESQLVDRRKAAIAAIDKKIAAMRAKMKSTLNKIGAFLKDAAKKFFKWALESLGLDAETFMATLQKAGKAITAIFKDPGKFFSNLVAAVKGSINDFVANFKKYLTEALFDWLMGTIGSVVTLPEKWDAKGVISVILQLAGISWAFIRKKLVDIFGEEKVAYAEEKVTAVKEIVERFLKDGVIGIWEWIKEQAETMMTTVIGGIKDWLLTKLVIGFAEWIVSLLVPGGAIMKLIEGIYKLVMWFVDNIGRIMRWVNALVNSVGNIAMGAIPAAVGFIVEAMKTMIPVILDFFAKLLNIGGIIDAIQKVIERIMKPIHKAINKVVDWIKAKIKVLVKKIRGEKAKPQESSTENETEQNDETVSANSGKINSFVDIDAEFKDETNHNHHAYYVGNKLIIASDPTPVEQLFREKEDEAKDNKDANLKINVSAAKQYYHGTVKPLEDALRQADLHDSEDGRESQRRQKNAKDYEDNEQLHDALKKAVNTFSQQYLDVLFDASLDEYPPAKLPLMADNVKAHSFTADYINSKVPNGTASSKHVGNLEGWSELNGRKIKNEKWVRMHLLPHQIGGDAVDSNLTPARGTINTVFSSDLELKAIDFAKKNPEKDRKVIWYKFEIKYFEGNVFPSYLRAQYGTYKADGNSWKRGEELGNVFDNPKYPDFEFAPFDMETCNWEPKDFANVTRVTLSFAKIIKDTANFTSIDNFNRRMNSIMNLEDQTYIENRNLIRAAERNNFISFES